MAVLSAREFWSPVRLWLVTDPSIAEELILDVAFALDASHGSAIGIWFRDKRPTPDLVLAKKLLKSLQYARFLAGSSAIAKVIGATAVHEPTLAFPSKAIAFSAPAHSEDEAVAAVDAGAQALIVSPIFKRKYENDKAGVSLITRTRAAVPNTYLYALGGVTGDNAASCAAAGANGVAVLTEVWQSLSPLDAADAIVKALP